MRELYLILQLIITFLVSYKSDQSVILLFHSDWEETLKRGAQQPGAINSYFKAESKRLHAVHKLTRHCH